MSNATKPVFDGTIAQIRRVPHFRDSQYANLDIFGTLEFFRKRYVQQISSFAVVSNYTVVADVGCGYGWLAMAFALYSPARVIAVDFDEPRLEAARQIASILSVPDRISWRVGSLGHLPMATAEADIVYCVEVIEHVRRDELCVKDLCRVSRNLIVLTTPNLWFPMIAHDTRLPFCHWLPLWLRRPYGALFGRECPVHNLFWSPPALSRSLRGFKRISRWLHYQSYQSFVQTFPFYLPYGRGRHVERPGVIKDIYYRIVSTLGTLSHFVTPSLAGVFERTRHTSS